MRSANRAGGHAPVIAKARIAVIKKAGNAKALLDAVPAEARRDIGYIFSRAQWLRRDDKIAEAAELMLSVPRDPAQAIDTDQWWIERRLLARKLLDLGDPKTAYRVARDAACRSRGQLSRRAPVHRRLDRVAFPERSGHRARRISPSVGQGTSNPITLARAGYWQGRAAEALGQQQRGARALRGGGALFDRLLRPDRPRPARA